MRGAVVEVKCNRCGDPFMARLADRKRGWGKFCSKSCKAVAQEQRTGQYRAYCNSTVGRVNDPFAGLNLTDADFGVFPGEDNA
jgi:endogenous inhibitor of DNA gyrase (YacG/DUF329 family)